jgi:phosphoribosylformimino-5-aminoimidazole carboxamide ribotide isomerase
LPSTIRGLVSEALLRWGAERIVVGIDARDGKVATHGWQSTSSVDAIELGHRMQALGVTRIVYTDISRDGMLSGVNLDLTSRLGDVTGPQGDRQRAAWPASAISRH